MQRFFRWLLGTRNGWMTLGATLLAGALYFQPDLLANIAKQIIGSILNLISIIIAGVLNGTAHVIQANQKSLEYLFCIVIILIALRYMIFGRFFKGGGKK